MNRSGGYCCLPRYLHSAPSVTLAATSAASVFGQECLLAASCAIDRFWHRLAGEMQPMADVGGLTFRASTRVRCQSWKLVQTHPVNNPPGRLQGRDHLDVATCRSQNGLPTQHACFCGRRSLQASDAYRFEVPQVVSTLRCLSLRGADDPPDECATPPDSGQSPYFPSTSKARSLRDRTGVAQTNSETACPMR